MSWFEMLEELPPDPIFGVSTAFKEDSRAEKVNLSVGAYRDGEGEHYVLDAVRQAERHLLKQELDKAYLPLTGDPDFLAAGQELLFGPENREGIASIQTVGGTGALRLAADFLAEKAGRLVVFSDPAWENYQNIFGQAGYQTETYPYYRANQFCFNDLCGVLTTLPANTLVVLQGSCHNPTGCDPSIEQWKELSDLIKHQRLIPLFDVAYQGFGENIDKDAAAVRHFASAQHEMLVAYSFSKNFGLYGERVGFLSAVGASPEGAARAVDHIKWIARGSYSTSSLQGSRIVRTILSTPSLRTEWESELESMRERIETMRQSLVEGLIASGCPHDLSFLKQQRGMFSYSGLTKEQVDLLREKHALYIPQSGRINVAGLNSHNLNAVIQAIAMVWK